MKLIYSSVKTFKFFDVLLKKISPVLTNAMVSKLKAQQKELQKGSTSEVPLKKITTKKKVI
jgi:hypothetical protein